MTLRTQTVISAAVTAVGIVLMVAASVSGAQVWVEVALAPLLVGPIGLASVAGQLVWKSPRGRVILAVLFFALMAFVVWTIGSAMFSGT